MFAVTDMSHDYFGFIWDGVVNRVGSSVNRDGGARWAGCFLSVEVLELGGEGLQVRAGGLGWSVTMVFVPCLEDLVGLAHVGFRAIKGSLYGSPGLFRSDFLV